MKFQNPSFKFFLNGRTNAHTDTRTSRKQYAPHFFKVGGIMIMKTINRATYDYLSVLLTLSSYNCALISSSLICLSLSLALELYCVLLKK